MSDSFEPGVNMGYFPPNYGDQALASLASQYGARSIRPGLFQHFLDKYGYDSRLSQFRFYRDSLGIRHPVAILGYPAESARDTNFYCPAHRSALFKNLYEPIWDHGENNTPVNDANPYAVYVWETARRYRGLIKVYEIWNEPDFNTDMGWRTPGMPGNWWENPPEPCDTRLFSPFFYYLRTLRISYEVIKRVDPDALVAVGGLGWPAYLDAVCRYTDEPSAGNVDPERYPNKGGAYFDCMSFHAYPHLMAANGKKLHSDGAIDALWGLKDEFEAVLNRHHYDDIVYPSKQWICSECNIPGRKTADNPAADTMQLNFLIKALITAPMHGLRQMHLYSLADEKTEDPDFSGMGLFRNLEGVASGMAQAKDLAWAYKTTANFLNGFVYDSIRTRKLQLPASIKGAAFRNKTGIFAYVLWAKTNPQQIENAEATYSFPVDFRLHIIKVQTWDFSRSGISKMQNARQLKLTGSPLFLFEVLKHSNHPK